MVSQSSDQQDFPVEPWEGVSDDSGDTDGSPHLLDTDYPSCPSDVRFTRHRAAWINPQDMQPQLQDLPLQVPTVGNIGSNFVGDATSPLGTSPLSLENSMVETSLWKDTVDSMGSSGKKSSDFSFNPTQERAVPPGRSPWMSPFTSSKILTASLCSEADSACFKPSHLTASTDEGAVQINRRSISLNSFSAEAFVHPVDVEKENAHFYAADMIISAMEKMKCNILSQQHTENWSIEEASGSLGNDQSDSEVTFYTNIKQESGSSTFSNSGYEGKWGKYEKAFCCNLYTYLSSLSNLEVCL
uniref:Rubicon like autophagy enhancer n=1 Tax=Myotis myotis TaxID=51298 RepID=A0A7J7Z8G8_MYOMY|nr:rubicon like autophagy enhancer [Myotis myotis]